MIMPWFALTLVIAQAGGGRIPETHATLYEIELERSAQKDLAAMKHSALVAKISVRQVIVNGSRRVQVDFEIKNTGRVVERLESDLALAATADEPPPLHITRTDGSFVGYVGPQINPGPKHRPRYIVIKAGASRTVRNVDVTDAYDWPSKPEKLTIKYQAITFAHKELRVVESASVEMAFEGL